MTSPSTFENPSLDGGDRKLGEDALEFRLTQSWDDIALQTDRDIVESGDYTVKGKAKRFSSIRRSMQKWMTV